MDAINSNIIPEIGKNISTAIGATAGVRGGLELVKNSPMPLPAKVATVAITAGLTTFATTTAVAAADSLMDFAEEQAANSAFNKDLPDGRAPSPEGTGSTMFSPADAG
jgi:hypothetical protein